MELGGVGLGLGLGLGLVGVGLGLGLGCSELQRAEQFLRRAETLLQVTQQGARGLVRVRGWG